MNNSTCNIKLAKTQVHKIQQSGRFLGRLLTQLRKTGSPLMKTVLKLLGKIVLIPLGLTAAASATYSAIQKNIFGSGMTTLTISNKEMNDIMKIVKPLKESALLTKKVSAAIKVETKEQNSLFLSMLLGRLGANLLGNLFIRNAQLEQVRARLEQAKIFNTSASFN